MGTIGWIKSNLMVSSQASEKGYSNENFYPGSDNVPESEKLYTRRKMEFETLQSYHIVDGIAKLYNNFKYGFMKVNNFPEIQTCSEFKIHVRYYIDGNYGGGLISFRQPPSSTYSNASIEITANPTQLYCGLYSGSTGGTWNAWIDETVDNRIWTELTYTYNRKTNLNTLEIKNDKLVKKFTKNLQTYTNTQPYFYLAPFKHNSSHTVGTRIDINNSWFEFKE